MFSENQTIAVKYPVSTSVAVNKPHFRERLFRVRHVRDLVYEPLTVAEFLRRPMVRRSRYLVHVLDLENNRYRKIYQRSAREWFRETPLRVGIFDGREIVSILGSNWGPSIKDRQSLVRFLCRMDRYPLGQLRLGVFSDDLEVIR